MHIVIIARGERVHRIETANGRLVDTRLRATRDDDVSLAQLEEMKSIPNGVRRRSTRRRGDVVRPFKTIF